MKIDISKLARQWWEQNKRRFQTNMMNEEETALSAYMAGYKAAQTAQADGACACLTPKLLWKESSGWYCGVCYKPARR